MDKDIVLVEDWIEVLELLGILVVVIVILVFIYYEIISVVFKRGYYVFFEKFLIFEYFEFIVLCKLVDKKKL